MGRHLRQVVIVATSVTFMAACITGMIPREGNIPFFSMTVQLPTDIAKLLGDLEISYNDSHGNGIAGYNWRLAGIPKISR